MVFWLLQCSQNSISKEFLIFLTNYWLHLHIFLCWQASNLSIIWCKALRLLMFAYLYHTPSQDALSKYTLKLFVMSVYVWLCIHMQGTLNGFIMQWWGLLNLSLLICPLRIFLISPNHILILQIIAILEQRLCSLHRWDMNIMFSE